MHQKDLNFDTNLGKKPILLHTRKLENGPFPLC